MVDKGTPGFKVGGKLEVIGIRGTGTAELVFNDCTVPATNMLGSPGDGFLIAMAVLNQGRIGAAAGALGVASAALEASISYSKKRVLFDRPLEKFECDKVPHRRHGDEDRGGAPPDLPGPPTSGTRARSS